MPAQKLDLYERYQEKFRDLRLAYIQELELELLKEGLKLEQAMAEFIFATKMEPSKAAQYMCDMSGPKSPFKQLPERARLGACK